MSRPDVKYTGGSSLTGSIVQGVLAVSVENADYSEGGWYGGVEDSDGYVVGTGTNTIGITGNLDTTGSPVINDAPTFWKSAGRTDQALIDIINQLPGSPNGFTDITAARAWMLSNNYGIITQFASSANSWVLLSGPIGCQPAWDDRVITFLDYRNGCQGETYIYNAVTGGEFAIYINGMDSTGTDKSSLLSSMIGNSGKIEFFQNGNFVTLSFSSDTWSVNSYGNIDGVYYDIEDGGTAPTIYDFNFDGGFNGFLNSDDSEGANVITLGANSNDLIQITITVDAPQPSGSVVTSIPGVASVNGTVLQTTQSPFSSGTSYYLGNSGYLALSAGPNFAFGTGDFTVEWFQWEYSHNAHARIFAIGQYPNADIAVSLEGCFYLMENAGWRVACADYGTILQTWVHFAVVRISGTTKVYKNGQSIASISDSYNIGNQNTNLNIGQESPATDAGAYFNGCITNFRIAKGLGIYTGNFTVPTGPLSTTASANPFGGSNTQEITAGYVKVLIQ
jgi:hypothetical protein